MNSWPRKNIAPKKWIRRESILLYRSIRFRKGFGVHSPFVYNLITKVIAEKGRYYRIDAIELVRKQFIYKEDLFPLSRPVASVPDDCSLKNKSSFGWLRRTKKRSSYRTTGDYVRNEAIRPKQGALLFRLANYLKPVHVLQIGSGAGLSTLYLTSYAPGLSCVVLENDPARAEVARQVFRKGARGPIDLRTGAYDDLLPAALSSMKQPGCIFFNLPADAETTFRLFEACLSCVSPQTVFIFAGIQSSRSMRAYWDAVCARPEATVTLDLFSLGLVFFNPKWHKKNYRVYF